MSRLRTVDDDYISSLEERQSLKGAGPSGTPPKVTDDPLKARVDFLQTAFLWLAGALVTATVAVIGIAVTMTNSTNGRLDKSVEVGSNLNREVGVVGTKIDDSNRRLDRIEQKLDAIGNKLSAR